MRVCSSEFFINRLLQSFILLCSATVSSVMHAAIQDFGNITRDTSSGLDWLDVTATQGMSIAEVQSEFGIGGMLEGWRYATQLEFSTLVQHLKVGPLFAGELNERPDFFLGSDLPLPLEPIDYSRLPVGTSLPTDSGLPQPLPPITFPLPIDPEVLADNVEVAIRLLGDTYDNHLDSIIMSLFDVGPMGAGEVKGFLKDVCFSDRAIGMNCFDHLVVSIIDLELVLRNPPDAKTSWSFSSDENDAISYFGLDENPTQVGSFLVRAAVPVPGAFWLFGSGVLVLLVKKKFLLLKIKRLRGVAPRTSHFFFNSKKEVTKKMP